jgi:hypothetical protein
MIGPGGWVVGVFLRFQSNGPATMTRLASTTAAANAQLARQTGMIDKNALAMANYKRKLEDVRFAQMRFGTMGAGAIAGIGITAMGTALSHAAKLQQILLSIKNETGASTAQLGQFYDAAFQIADKNGMTVEASGEILRTISRLTAGQFDVNKMIKVAPVVADYASMVHFNRPEISVERAAQTGLQTAHLFRAYDPAALTKLLDSVYRLSGMMSEGPEEALRQMSYYVPMFKALGIGDQTSIATMALLDRAGFRNKVGTNVRAEVLEALGPLQLTKHAQTGKLNILQEMGLFKNGKFAFNRPDGSLDFFGELEAIGNFAQRERSRGIPAAEIAQKMFGALGKQGGTIAALFLDPQMAPILKGLRNYQNDPNVGLTSGGRQRDQGLAFQAGRAMNNGMAVVTELAYPWLNQMTDFFRKMGDTFHGAQVWLHQHREIEKTIGAVFAGITALSAVRFSIGVANMLTRGARALGMIAEEAPAATTLGRVSGALRAVDRIFTGGSIQWAAKASASFYRGALSLTTKVMDALTFAIEKSITPTGFGKAFGEAFASDLIAGVRGAFAALIAPFRALLMTPFLWIQNAFGRFGPQIAKWAPGIARDLDKVGGVIAKVAPWFGTLLERLTPLLNVAGIVLTPSPTAPGDLTPAEAAAEAHRHPGSAAARGGGWGSFDDKPRARPAHRMEHVNRVFHPTSRSARALDRAQHHPAPVSRERTRAVSGRAERHHHEGARTQVTIGKVEISLPNVKSGKDANQIADVLRNPRSMMASAASNARTHHNVPMVLSVPRT